MSYATQAVLWVVGMAVAGWAVRPLINRISKERDRWS